MPSFTWKIDTQEEAQAIASPSSKEVKPHSITSSIDFPTKEKKIKKTKTSIKKKKKNHDFKLTKLTPVLHYVLVIKRKEGQSPFSGDEESRLKDLQGLTLPVAKITKPKPSSQPLKGFTRPSQERSLGVLLAQENEEGKENALYYLSRTLNGAEFNYSPIEKICLALMFAIQKLRHYLHAHSIRLIS